MGVKITRQFSLDKVPGILSIEKEAGLWHVLQEWTCHETSALKLH
jgi:hypothetical protein